MNVSEVSSPVVTGYPYRANDIKAGMTAIAYDSSSNILGNFRIRKDWGGETVAGSGILYIAEAGSGLINWAQTGWIDVIDEYRPG